MYYQTCHVSFQTEVEIFFTDDNFRATERNMINPNEPTFMPVQVTKSSRIANRIALGVVPLTVDMARAKTPSALPENIPVVNPFSPPFAGSKCLSFVH